MIDTRLFSLIYFDKPLDAPVGFENHKTRLYIEKFQKSIFFFCNFTTLIKSGEIYLKHF